MSYELTQRFFFEAAHTLHRRHDAEGSRRIHGHTYRARVTVGGPLDPATGMVVDLAQLREAIARTRTLLDHRFLDDVEHLGPATLENLCAFIMRNMDDPAWRLLCVEVEREASGDSCLLRAGPAGASDAAGAPAT